MSGFLTRHSVGMGIGRGFAPAERNVYSPAL